MDFSWEKRDSVITHLEDYYGKTKVAHIGTYTTMGVKNGLKDVGRVFGMDFAVMNNISKLIDEINDKPGAQFKDFDAMKDGDENEKKLYEKFHAMETEHQEVWEQTRMLALYCVAPYSKKALKPQDLFRFPWESNTGATAKKKQLSKKEHLEVFEKWCKKLEGS